MLEDARKLRFRNILFNAHKITLETPFVNKLLDIFVNRRLDSDRRLWLRNVDLLAVPITEQTVNKLSDSCTIRNLTLGITPGGCDESLDINQLETLTLVNNAHLSIKFLAKESFTLITSLKFIGCNEVPMDKLYNFILNNTSLTTLTFKDSQSRNQNSVDLLIAVFSGKNIIEEFQFDYTSIKEFRAHLIPNLVLKQTTLLKKLSLQYNDFFEDRLL